MPFGDLFKLPKGDMKTGRTGAGYFGDMFALPEGFKRPRSAPNRMEGLTFPQKLNYMAQFEGPSLMALGAGISEGDTPQGFRDMAKIQAGYQGAYADEAEQDRTRAETMQYLLNHGVSQEDAEAAAQNPAIMTHLLSPKAAGGTDDLQEYNYAVSQGFQGSFVDFKLAQIKAGVPSPVGAPPPGYELRTTPEGGYRMQPIPGGPAETSQVVKQGQADVATRVVTTAAERARQAAGQRQFGGYGQGAVEQLPWTDAAEVRRQVDVLKSTAKVENLNAMRAASPTGGALGNVTEQESAMLASKSGALDPSSPTFDRDLDDYELTLLQVIHGPQEGQQIFQATRQQAQPAPLPAGGGNGGWTIRKK